jgi:3D (Asp-Asp-Asp) domain-containing protein
MLTRSLIILTLFFSLYLSLQQQGQREIQPEVLGTHDIADNNQSMTTKTAFNQKEETEVTPIPFETIYKKDDTVEWGTQKVTQEGVEGNKTTTYLITYWQDETLNKEVLDTKITEPKAKEIAQGTKIVWKETSFSDVGNFKYWGKLKVWATKYDGNCIGCRGLTYSGTPVRKGTCAVDPKVITLGSYFYVEGYGLCKAEDIGGGIKGNKIDLGYEDVKKGTWRTGYTNIYLLTPPDDKD